MSNSTPLWTPSPQKKSTSNLAHFLHWLEQKKQKSFTDYQALYEWSCNQSSEFWQSAAEFFDIIFHQKPTAILENPTQMPGAKWFPGATLNFAQNLLRKNNNDLAIIFTDELDHRTTYTYAQLYQEVAQLAAALKAAGVSKHDRVAAIVPNCHYAIIGMLATTSLGAVWSSCSPDFGDSAIVDRFSQIEPKILFAIDGYYFKGKTINCQEKTKNIAAQIDSIKQVVEIPFIHSTTNSDRPKNLILWSDFLKPYQDTTTLSFTPVSFSDPLYIMFSSGTTGKPKCIVHSLGGTLIQHLKELILHTDLTEKDHFFFYTTCGWMMWNWLVSGLATGATLVLYDGNPFYPTEERLFELAEKEKISIFGTSAKFLAAIEKSGVKPNQKFKLTNLRSILSTGSPLLPENFDYVYRDIKSDLCLSSISGGTDIISCFALGNPLLPVYRGELQCIGLGLAVSIFNEQGQSITQEKGELVCTKPFPSMPIGFWNDKDGARYHAAYFEKFSNVWAHGDYAEITEHHGVVVFGRSDSVLNPGGVRIGTAEIYAQVEKIAEVEESLAVGQLWHDDERIILFIKLKSGVSFSKELEQQIRNQLRTHASPRHVPAKIIPIADIPRTINNKISEIAVKNVIHGLPVKNKEALANPESLGLFEGLKELSSD
jgi:acetoacetyl-CoA synthetase